MLQSSRVCLWSCTCACRVQLHLLVVFGKRLPSGTSCLLSCGFGDAGCDTVGKIYVFCVGFVDFSLLSRFVVCVCVCVGGAGGGGGGG